MSFDVPCAVLLFDEFPTSTCEEPSTPSFFLPRSPSRVRALCVSVARVEEGEVTGCILAVDGCYPV